MAQATDQYGNPITNYQDTSAYNTLSELNAPFGTSEALDQATYAGYLSQLQQLPGNTALTNQYQTQLAGLQGQGLGISGQQIGLQQQGLTLSTQLAAQQQGIEQQQYGIGQQQYNLQMGQYPEEQAEAATQYQQQNMALQGQTATSGAQGAAGTKLANFALGQNYGFQQADISRNQQLAQLSNQSTQLGQQSELAGYNESQQQNALSAQNLSLMAQANGLSEQQLIDQLNYGISQNNLQGTTSATTLLGQMGSLAAGDISTAGTAIAPIAYAGGINPYAVGG